MPIKSTYKNGDHNVIGDISGNVEDAVGYQSLYANTTGSQMIAIGSDCLLANTILSYTEASFV